jgi:hypothetical protein
MKIKTNEGTVDRIIRIVLGIILLFVGMAGLVGSGIGMWLAYVFGAILLVTGIVGFCPLYALLKINTAKK